MDKSMEDIKTSIRELLLAQQDDRLHFKETERLLKELFLETNLRFQETDRQFKETDRKIEENNRALTEQFKETDRKIKENNRALTEQFKETDRIIEENYRILTDSFQETDRKFQDVSKEIRRVNQAIGDLGDKFGYFTEGMALPTMERVLSDHFGIDSVSPRFKKKLPGGENLEYDVLGYVNGQINNVVVVEIKSKLRRDHIADFVASLRNFRHNFPEHASKHLYGIMAAVDVPDKDLVEEVSQAGLHFARIADDVFSIRLNPQALDYNANA